jgi:muconolactone delta-isomerase
MTRLLSAPRPLRPALTILVALAAALVALALWGGPDAQAHENGQRAAKAKISQQELALRNDMRRLWEDHVTWTRLAIISLTTDAPDTQATVGRLLRNQTDIGDAIEPFYGQAAGDELTRLLRDHILIAADLIAAARAGDQAGVADAQARWTANADEIAAFLASANPRSWKVDEMKAMLHEHLRLTTNEALARLQGDWDADVAAYDQIHLQALEMADMLSTGIVQQFPRRFR